MRIKIKYILREQAGPKQEKCLILVRSSIHARVIVHIASFLNHECAPRSALETLWFWYETPGDSRIETKARFKNQQLLAHH